MAKTTRFRHYRDDSIVLLRIPRYLISDMQFLCEEIQNDPYIIALKHGERYKTTARELWKRFKTAYLCSVHVEEKKEHSFSTKEI